MRHAFYLAWAYIRFHALKSAVLVLAIGLIVAMPLATRLVLDASERVLTTRAEATPLLVGAKGSALDVLMTALYFTDDRPQPLTMAASERVWDSGLAVSIPVYVRFSVDGAPIVGTSLDYFDLRGLTIAEGRGLAVLGEAVLGARAAERLGVGVGQHIISDPVNLFDLAGSYPLRMPVVGVLEPEGSPDDDGVFVDIKTSWVIEGIGHGHDNLTDGMELVLDDIDGDLVISEALPLFNEITPESLPDYHFHGDPNDYPISAVIAVPPNRKAATILRGRYVHPLLDEQIVVPSAVVQDLLQTVFKIGRILDAVILAAVLSALLAIAVTIYLSLELRRGELTTLFKLGSARATSWRLVAAELFILVSLGVFSATVATAALAGRADRLAIWLLSIAV